MNAKEAMRTIKNKYPSKVVVECLEFNDFYAFALSEPGRENEDVGGGYDTVSKKNGNVSTFNPTEDFEAFMSATGIDIKTLT